MDRECRQKIYTLLSQFYPNAKQLQSKETLTAWGMVLARYDYEAVKASVLDYAAKNRFFPNLSDLTAELPVQEEQTDRTRGARAWMAQYMTPEYEARFPGSGVSKYAREHGVTWREAAAALEKEAKKRMEETE